MQGRSGHELGDQIQRIPVRTGLVQRGDRGMGESRGRECLAVCAVAGVRVLDALDRHLASQHLVARAPDDAEAARAEPLDQPIAPEEQLTGGDLRVLGHPGRGDGARRQARGSLRVSDVSDARSRALAGECFRRFHRLRVRRSAPLSLRARAARER